MAKLRTGRCRYVVFLVATVATTLTLLPHAQTSKGVFVRRFGVSCRLRPLSHRSSVLKASLRASDPAHIARRASAEALMDARAGAVTIGLDFGTSGARVVALPLGESTPVFEASRKWGTGGASDPLEWNAALHELCGKLPEGLRSRAAAVAIDGTSSSVLLTDRAGAPTTDTRMYNWDAASEAPNLYKQALALMDAAGVPETHTVRAPTSTLSKVLAWMLESPRDSEVVMHQADFVNSLMLGNTGQVISDWHNALKLGFDVGDLCWPQWLLTGPIAEILPPQMLPQVVRPGTVLGCVSSDFGMLPSTCKVAAGTTDSIAAFLACGVTSSGEAVTSLGSTLAVKMLSATRVDDAARGVYSHRLWQSAGTSDSALWLVGGASNVGCAVLRAEHFSVEELVERSAMIDPNIDSPLAYYPLVKRGERFPYCDPAMEPVLTPLPESRTEYLHGILQGIAQVERTGYDALRDLGADPLQRVFTAGGGAANDVWTAMRERMLGVPVSRAPCVDAAVGAARVAAQSI